jgi:hypothetical protein
MKLGSFKRHAWMERAARLAGAAILGCATLAAQNFMLNPLTTAGVQQDGFRIYNFSAYTSYSTVDPRWNQFLESLSAPAVLNLPSHTTFSGFTGSVGFHSGREDKWSFSAIYSPSYSYSENGVNYGSWTHVLALNWQVKLKPQWELSVSGSGITGNFQQLLFSPNGSQSLASLANTAQGLASTVLTGQSSDPGVAAASAASATVSAQQQLFYGDRMVSAVLQVGLTYAYSTRFSVGISASGNRMQHLVDNSVPAGQNYYLIPETTTAAAALSLNYLLTPRTSITGTVSSGRTLSILNRAQYASSEMAMGRTLTEHWFSRIGGGAGYIMPLGSTSTFIHGVQWEGSGGIGYRAGGHVVMASAHRAVADYYGLGAAGTLTATLGWGWRPRGASWFVQAGAGENRLLGNQISALGLGNNGLLANAGVYWRPFHGAAVGLQYAFASYSGIFPVTGVPGPGEALRYVQHTVRLNVGWGMAMAQTGSAGNAP